MHHNDNTHGGLNDFGVNFSNEQMLSEINKAICTILAGGQSYKIGSRELRRANLSQLYNMKKEYEAAIEAENNTGIGRHSAAAFFDRR